MFQTIQINHITYHYEILGSGSDELVFIPGYTGDINSWKNIAQKFLSTHRILIFDPQGSSLTMDNNEPLTVETIAKNIYTLYSTLDFKKPELIGFALGAGVALSIAHQFPGTVKGLVLAAAVFQFSDIAKDLCERLCQYREEGTEDAFKNAAKIIYEHCFSEKFKKDNEQSKFVEQNWSHLRNAQSPTGQRRQVEALKKYDASLWCDSIKERNLKGLIISPSEDRFSPPAKCQQLASALGINLQSVQSGHAILLEQPEEVTDLIRNYLQT